MHQSKLTYEDMNLKIYDDFSKYSITNLTVNRVFSPCTHHLEPQNIAAYFNVFQIFRCRRSDFTNEVNIINFYQMQSVQIPEY